MSKRPGDPGYSGSWCIHFRDAFRHKTCEAGVEFAKFDDVKFGKRPCFLIKETGASKPDAAPCERLRRPTPDEIAAHDEWITARLNRISVVMLGIKPWRDAHKGQSAAEVIECPACKGRLHLSIAAYNGHVHGQCETPDCVRWVE